MRHETRGPPHHMYRLAPRHTPHNTLRRAFSAHDGSPRRQTCAARVRARVRTARARASAPHSSTNVLCPLVPCPFHALLHYTHTIRRVQSYTNPPCPISPLHTVSPPAHTQGDRRRDDRSKHRALSDRPTRPLVDDTEDSDGGESETATKVQTEVISDDEDDPSEVSRGVRDRGEDGKDEDEDEEVARRPRREKKAADRAGTKKTPRREKKSSVAANKHHLERELGFSEMGGKPHSRRFAF